MKQTFTFLLAFVFAIAASAKPLVVTPKPEPKPGPNAHQVMIPLGKNGEKISLYDLSIIKAKDLQVLTGKKMNLVDRIGFVAAQKNLRNSINEDGSLDSKKLKKFAKKVDGGDFNIGGFALGFLLGLIGVLIAYIISDDKKRARVKWAWLGLAAWLVILLIILIL